MKKAVEGKKDKRARKEQREKTRAGRKLKRQQNRERNRVSGPMYLSLSRKSLARADKRLKEMWTQQAADWVAINKRSWEFGSFQNQVIPAAKEQEKKFIFWRESLTFWLNINLIDCK